MNFEIYTAEDPGSYLEAVANVGPPAGAPASETAVRSVFAITKATADSPASAALNAIDLIAWVERGHTYAEQDLRLACLVSQDARQDPAVVLAAAQRAYVTGSVS